MSLAEQLADKIKVKVTKPEPDDRISLLGVPFELDEDGKWSCLIPASGKSYFKQLFPHYEFGEEFLPEEKKVEPEKKVVSPAEEKSQFICDVCGVEAASKAGLAAHKRAKH